jgi:hypothetical protein
MARNEDSGECVFPPPGESDVPRCAHDSVVVLGQDGGNNLYKRCRDCGAVVLVFGAAGNWERVREERTAEPRDWNPLLDALRRNQTAAEDPQGRNRSLSEWARSVWNRLGPR